MGVFTPTTISELGGQARKLAASFFETRPLVITADEFVAGFIDPEHVKMLMQTEEICGRIGNTSSVMVDARTRKQNAMHLTVSFYGQSPIIIPNYVGNGLRPTAPDHLRTRVQDWIEERWDYGCVFGDLLDALEFYNVVCNDAKAMTVMVPILPTLLRNITPEADSRTSKRAKRLSEMKGVNSLPSVPRAVTKRVHDACHLMTAANLIETVAPPKLTDGSAIVSFSSPWQAPKRPSLFAGVGHIPKKTTGTFV